METRSLKMAGSMNKLLSLAYPGKCTISSRWKPQYLLRNCNRSYCKSTDLVSSNLKDGTAYLTLNNSRKRNILSLEMLHELHERLLATESNEHARVIVLSAVGNVFSSGHDLKELKSNEELYRQKVMDKCCDVMQAIHKLSIPVIAKVNGLAAAAGCQLVASCDIVIASNTSTFSTPGVKVGLFCSTPAVALARAIPNKLSMLMLMTGDAIDADTALTYGLVSKVVPEDVLDDETDNIVNKIKSYSKPVLTTGKRCFYKQIQLERSDAYKVASTVMVDNLDYADTNEGISAFLGKRFPKWSHK